MNTQWRLFLAALRLVTRRTAQSTVRDSVAIPMQAAIRFLPAAGILIGLIAAAVYWTAAQIWPTSVALVLSMLATVLLTANRDASPTEFGALYWVFVLLVKYNALMALSAANMPFTLPAFFALGLIMMAAQAASRALEVSVMAADTRDGVQVAVGDLVVALLLGLAPATLLGIPGLIGLVAAIVTRLILVGYVLPKLDYGARERLVIVQQLTEAGFYLGALASWKYV